jgi:predicted GNAT family N-acyltransferase
MEVREVRDRKELEQCFDLRYRVLREPWEQPRGSERDELDASSYQAGAFRDGKLVGTARLSRLTGKTCKVNRVAVEESCRGSGIGAALMAHAEGKAAEWGCRKIILNARENAVSFYEKLGYRKLHETETMFGAIRHFRMEKKL